MKKISEVLYNKLMLQAEEAKEQNMEEIAFNIKEAIGPNFSNELEVYSEYELQSDLQQGLWKLAICALKYYNIESIDAEKLNQTLESVASNFLNEIESILGPEALLNINESILPGETK